MKPAHYKCMSVIIDIIISVASYQMSFTVLLLSTFCFAPEKWACKPFESRYYIQILSPLVIILFILITLSLDDVWVLLGENWC